MSAPRPPVHAEAVPGRPSCARWVVPPGSLRLVGVPERVPAPLARLLDEGLLVHVEVEPAAVLLELAPAHTWAASGDVVRGALQDALTDPEGWVPADGDDPAREHLAAAAREVLAGEVGAYARSHGGSLELVAVHDGVVDVELRGTCDGCPAAGRTLEDRVLTAIRSLDPSVTAVRSVRPDAPSDRAGGRRLLPLVFRR
ncbi:NifU family protein [Nocardioides sp. TRM66260-LWL]|uniref:NifU family protein n=1 Tax=Nocardioides sp. TRM66260-LWL TaxID=2874478 RepID=UPI001CC47745|nr:NifU family protein [Nocardioides sp. TRM66260-LWL]MBZ5734111.1 NifU family protein [Nocardioides sp. TRM66260-LWL]